jgi:hypothetical protein
MLSAGSDRFRGGRLKNRNLVGALMTLGLLASLIPSTAAAPASGQPTLSLRRVSDQATAYKFGNRRARLYLPVYLQAQDAPLDLRVRRAGYDQPLTLTQVFHTPGGTRTEELPSDALDGWRGLIDFTDIEVHDADGQVVFEKTLRFCPNGWDGQRIDDEGPTSPGFPYGCFGNRSPFLLGMAWGIDQGWATRLIRREMRLDLAPGEYELVVRIDPDYQELFGIDRASATKTLELTVKEYEQGDYCCRTTSRAVAQAQNSSAGAVATVTNPDPSMLPDLQAVPAFYMSLRNRRNGKSQLSFASMVWVGGASSLVVEGFRRGEEEVMDAYQYFYDGDEAVGRAPVGTFEYDRRDGHFHWHFQQFAAYRVIDADTNEVVRSSKQSFCLAPTDPVDLSLDNAVWNAYSRDLYTSCGGSDALWIREVLPVGWGDTYFQVAGQAFDVTTLPNGTYWVEVEANPGGLLHEQDSSNNVVLRQITLDGKTGARSVVVEPWFGLDI